MAHYRWFSFALFLSLAAPVGAAPAAPSGDSGPFAVRPRSTDAVYAEEEVDVEFFLGDSRRSDPVLGPGPVLRASLKAQVTMPAMPGMGAMVPVIHEEGQPGYYGMVLNFPHAGDYLATLRIVTRGGETGTVSLPLKVLDA